MKTKDRIPKGQYCYGYNGMLCPYWEEVQGKPEYLNGYCDLLKLGDWMKDTRVGELWDQLKICGINEEYGDE